MTSRRATNGGKANGHSKPRTQFERDAAHIPTDETREHVAICRMARMTDDELAESFDISVERLQECYNEELLHGSAKMRRELVVDTYKRAKGGSTAAVKNLEILCREPLPVGRHPRDVVAAMQQAQRNHKMASMGLTPDGSRKPRVEKPATIGKKERQQRDAKTAAVGTPWSNVLPKHNGLQ